MAVLLRIREMSVEADSNFSHLHGLIETSGDMNWNTLSAVFYRLFENNTVAINKLFQLSQYGALC